MAVFIDETLPYPLQKSSHGFVAGTVFHSSAVSAKCVVPKSTVRATELLCSASTRHFSKLPRSGECHRAARGSRLVAQELTPGQPCTGTATWARDPPGRSHHHRLSRWWANSPQRKSEIKLGAFDMIRSEPDAQMAQGRSGAFLCQDVSRVLGASRLHFSHRGLQAPLQQKRTEV